MSEIYSMQVLAAFTAVMDKKKGDMRIIGWKRQKQQGITEEWVEPVGQLH